MHRHMAQELSRDAEGVPPAQTLPAALRTSGRASKQHTLPLGGDKPRVSPQPAEWHPDSPSPGALRADDSLCVPARIPAQSRSPGLPAGGFVEACPSPSFPGTKPGAIVPSVNTTPNSASDLGYIMTMFCASVSLTVQWI